ncbi:hypothetical protein ACKC9G_09130 [Pokkaliibacter sp. CJK22405]|uniref:hypothetical protein n=1 Tax=Pokkaliibacter sp. CJK22405 TaxID=3384615 RepID=UPI0039855CCE
MVRWGLSLLGVPLLSVILVYCLDWRDISECLQQGKAYDYGTGQCVQGLVVFRSFTERHTYLMEASALMALVGLSLCAFGLFRRS